MGRSKTWQNLGGKTGRWMEMMLSGAGCPGWPDVRGSRAGCPGSGSMDELDELVEKSKFQGKIREILWMELGEKMGES